MNIRGANGVRVPQNVARHLHVEAGRAGQFGYVIGVDRVGHGKELHRHGADVVVTDLATLLEVAA